MIRENSSAPAAGGIGFCGLLTIAFIVLKLCNVIHWSWVWVLFPIWIPIALVIVILIGIVLFAIIDDFICSLKRGK